MPAFFARITNAGYAQFPDLVVVTPLPGFSPGSPPPRPTPGPTPPGGGGPVDPGYSPPWAQIPVDPGYGIPERPPLGFWGPNDPRPTHPIVLPPATPIPPDLLPGLPDPGEPGSPSNPYPPGSTLPPHPATGLNTFYLVIPYVGVVGPYTVPPGAGQTPPAPPVTA